MTAIAGIWSSRSAPVARLCQGMLAALSVYGPEHTAQYAGQTFAMGRCLLGLLPEDRYDRQPLLVADAPLNVTATVSDALVADVRLDNREELGRALSLSPAQLAGMADSDVLLAAWQSWGESCVHHLRGGFAFAVWNEPAQQLFLARDHGGERPLFYAAGSHGFAFASMPKGLHALPFVPAAVDEEYVARGLALASSPVERTIFHNLQRLPPGCALRLRDGHATVWKHWQTEQLRDLRLASPAAYLECFQEIFTEAVRARLRTRGEIGAQLSGGLDSGAVAATAAGLLAAQNRGLTCYTAVPREDFRAAPSNIHFHDEGPAAAEVAALYGNASHLRVQSSGSSFLDILDPINRLYDHPCFAPTNEVWVAAIFDQARAAGVTLVLNGNSGNSTFSYEGMSAFSAWFRSGHWGTLLRVARRLAQSGHTSMRSIARHAVWPSLPFPVRSVTDPHMRGFSLDDYCVLHPALAKRYDLRRQAYRDLNRSTTDGRSMLRRMLRYGDVGDTPVAAQGGWQLDYRDPTWDRRVIEFCLAVPLEEFLRDGQRRSLARRSMQGRLPAATLQQTRRGLQAADWHMNMTALLPRMAAEVQRLRASPMAARVLDLDRMRALIERWPAAGDSGASQGSHHIALTRGFAVGRFLMSYET